MNTDDCTVIPRSRSFARGELAFALFYLLLGGPGLIYGYRVGWFGPKALVGGVGAMIFCLFLLRDAIKGLRGNVRLEIGPGRLRDMDGDTVRAHIPLRNVGAVFLTPYGQDQVIAFTLADPDDADTFFDRHAYRACAARGYHYYLEGAGYALSRQEILVAIERALKRCRAENSERV